MILLVTGGRNYANRDHVYKTLNEISRARRITGLIHGMATGLDTIAKEWMEIRIRREFKECAERRRSTPKPIRLPHIQYHPVLWMVGCPAMWGDLETPPVCIKTDRTGRKYNAAAGSNRNAQMLKWHPTACAVFPGGIGTANMRYLATEAQIEIIDATRE